MWVSSLVCGNPILAEFWKLGEERSEADEARGLEAQLKMGCGGRVKRGGCFVGIGEEELVFRLDENSWDK